MNELDILLAQVRDAPVNPRLNGLDTRVIAEMARIRSNPVPSRSTFGVAVAAALVIGIAGATLPTHGVEANSISSFDMHLPLAPSTLLLGAP
ncbi:hypothetical protein FXF46_02475 [Gluconobacter thailandicus]|uniref:Uncharacterized protein n=1 Tax=Gluconobacter thailandicus TaxID=257438 RepID=A0AAP9JHC5_GLUTH|nr:hypothetical protein FXF46_02475 [Gluconobacter thailandicus]